MKFSQVFTVATLSTCLLGVFSVFNLIFNEWIDATNLIQVPDSASQGQPIASVCQDHWFVALAAQYI